MAEGVGLVSQVFCAICRFESELWAISVGHESRERTKGLSRSAFLSFCVGLYIARPLSPPLANVHVQNHFLVAHKCVVASKWANSLMSMLASKQWMNECTRHWHKQKHLANSWHDKCQNRSCHGELLMVYSQCNRVGLDINQQKMAKSDKCLMCKELITINGAEHGDNLWISGECFTVS